MERTVHAAKPLTPDARSCSTIGRDWPQSINPGALGAAARAPASAMLRQSQASRPAAFWAASAALVRSAISRRRDNQQL